MNLISSQRLKDPIKMRLFKSRLGTLRLFAGNIYQTFKYSGVEDTENFSPIKNAYQFKQDTQAFIDEITKNPATIDENREKFLDLIDGRNKSYSFLIRNIAGAETNKEVENHIGVTNCKKLATLQLYTQEVGQLILDSFLNNV